MKRPYKLISLSILFYCLVLNGFSQTKRITGIVQDAETANPLSGASVRVQSSQNGTITDDNGQFNIDLDVNDNRLVITYLGYLQKVVDISDGIKVIIELEPDKHSLNSVVVVGYGEQKKETMTGAVSTVDGQKILEAPVSNISNSLAGRLPGLTTVQRSGEPGADEAILKLRGIGTLSDGASSDPLILIDGVPRNNMNLLDPNEIESISILKDASATAVYGVRGANGVILITTKKGSDGRPKVGLSSSVRGQMPTRLPSFLNSYDYARLKNEGLENDGLPPLFTEEMLNHFKNHDAPEIYADQDLVKYFVKPISLMQQDNLNVSGGNNRVLYYLSFGYEYQNGSYKMPFDIEDELGFNPNPRMDRYNFRSNVDLKVTKGLTASIKMGYMRRIINSPAMSTSAIMKDLMEIPPFATPGIIDGKLINTYVNDPLKNAGVGGPLSTSIYDKFFNDGYRNGVQHTLNTSVELKQKLDFITSGLSVRGMFAYDDFYERNLIRSKALEKYSVYVEPGTTNYHLFKATDEGNFSTSENHNMNRKEYLEVSVNYERDFEVHSFTGMILYNQIKEHDPNFAFHVPQGVQGLVSRFTYDYDRKYLAEINMGYNGSENFPKGHRFQIFPSYSFGWVPTREPFFPDHSFMNFLKIRGSYGEVGNDKIGGDRFLYLPSTYTFLRGQNEGYDFGVFGENREHYFGSEEDKIGNPNITWEVAKKIDLGIEMRLFNSQLSVEADYFEEKRNNILINLGTIPNIVAASLPPANMGVVKNRGFEIELRWRQQINKFNYSLGGNLSFNRNEVIFMDEPIPEYYWMGATGFPVNQLHAKRSEGFFNEQEEVENRPFYSFYGNKVQRGDIKYVDINGDGIIDFRDEVPTGYSRFPEIVYGLPLSIQYANFDLSILIQGASHIWGNFTSSLGPAFPYGTRSTLAKHLERWSVERYERGEEITQPRLGESSKEGPNGDMAGTTDFWMINQSYVRLKNVQLSYRLNQEVVRKFGLENVMVYISGNNLFTVSDLKSFDPERASGSTAVYPVMKIINLGINIDF